MSEENKPELKKEDLFNEKGLPLYPKWVEKADGSRVIVQTPDEEKNVLADKPKPKANTGEWGK